MFTVLLGDWLHAEQWSQKSLCFYCCSPAFGDIFQIYKYSEDFSIFPLTTDHSSCIYNVPNIYSNAIGPVSVISLTVFKDFLFPWNCLLSQSISPTLVLPNYPSSQSALKFNISDVALIVICPGQSGLCLSGIIING